MAHLDFNTLVSRSNPASGQYQAPLNHRGSGSGSGGHGYPPGGGGGGGDAERQNIFLIEDDFDEDDSKGLSPSGFHSHSGHHTQHATFGEAGMTSTESGLPLTKAAASLAGAGYTDGNASTSWMDDDPDMMDDAAGREKLARGTVREKVKREWFGGGGGGKRWRWPWAKEEVLEGERVIEVNDEQANHLLGFDSNYVSTSKYNPATFLPKFLLEQFSKYANLFFLFTALIQQVPGVSPTNRWTTIVPLALVLLASAFKETQEDVKRHQSDAELNARKTKVLVLDRVNSRGRDGERGERGGGEGAEGNFVEKPWRNIRVGDVVRLENNEFIPADMVLLSSSEPEGLCYVETANLDGETNLKIKQASTQTSHLLTPQLVTSLRGTVRCERPNNSLYTFSGTLSLLPSSSSSYPTAGGLGAPGGKQIPLGPDQMLLRGAQLRNTPWLYGFVVYTGHQTKLMRNATSAPIKRTNVERQVNTHIIFLFGLLIVLSLVSTIGSSIRSWFFSSQQWYLADADAGKNKARFFIEDILTFVILYNNLIPISLIVTMEVVKFQQSILINSDLDMYHPVTDTPALCRTSSLVEELGQIEYVFSDKTGTLTRNEMEFRACSVAGVAYSEVVDESKKDEVDALVLDGSSSGGGYRTFQELREILSGGAPRSNNPFADPASISGGAPGLDQERVVLKEFLTLLAVCHTVIPEIGKGGKMVYQASSPDEAALVAGAELLGYQFTTRKPKSVFLNIAGSPKPREFEILNVCEFNSTRKRMSTLVRTPEGKIKLYCKGADTVILERLAKEQQYVEKTLVHLEDYATEGLRTLCIATRDISESEYASWSKIYDQAANTIQNRGEALDNAAELIERDMFFLGATAIEDKLQEGVPDTIHTLQSAGIKIWVLTGDRQETAINIGLSCRLISESMNMVIINEETAQETKDFITKRLTAIKNQRKSGELEDLALIIDGKSLTFALEKDISKTFLELAIMCKAVICCRVSPLQKALVVKLVKKNQRSILLAIGDGANDVSMIQAAHVGVGISGVEGLQAARSSDVAISQFRFLKKLLLVHGAWSYQRLSKLILFSFYKNIVLYMTQFWFSFFNNFSGQIANESWTLSFYNVLFTVLPPLVIGIFDQFVSARILDRYPQLYILGQSNAFFTKKAFWLWIGNALYHSLILFGFTVIMFWGDLKQATGWDSGHWFWGTTLYLAVLVTVLGKAALISDLWTKYTVAAIPGSLAFTMVSLPLYALIAPVLGFSVEYEGLVPRLWSDWVFYFTLLLIPVVCLTRDFAWKYYRRTYLPKSYHIAQELQKYNIPDYRPRQEQFQKAIKKVRAVQRMRRNRGFAFSQTETADHQDQARLIRAYDTSKSHARPSGY